jgi:glycolate oxidase iron-sulfur subunit
MLQPELSSALKARKLMNIASVVPDAVAAGNIGCIEQIASGTDVPVLHIAQLLDWATGGPKPEGLSAPSASAAAE